MKPADWLWAVWAAPRPTLWVAAAYYGAMPVLIGIAASIFLLKLPKSVTIPILRVLKDFAVRGLHS